MFGEIEESFVIQCLCLYESISVEVCCDYRNPFLPKGLEI